ncbi:MAG: hypothetical protein ACOVNU_03135 [Candidatus Kapaibacteriota bacterium]
MKDSISTSNTNLVEEEQNDAKILANAQAEYQKILDIANIHIAASKKIIDDNGLVPIIPFTESILLSLLKQLYKSGSETLIVPNPNIQYNIKALTTPPSQQAQEVEFEVVD